MRPWRILLTIPFLCMFLLAACNLPTGDQEAEGLPDATAAASPSQNGPSPGEIPLPLVPDAQVFSIEMLDPLNGWALASGYVLRTDDGGSTWYDATPTGVSDFVSRVTSRFFLDIHTAWLLILAPQDGMPATLYITGDGGLTWTATGVPFDGGDLRFVDPDHGRVLVSLGAAAGSQAVAIYQTADGGVNWNQVYINDPTVPGAADSLPLSGRKTGMTFSDPAHGWVTGDIPMEGFVYLYTTGDGGASWSLQAPRLPVGFETAMTVLDAPVFFNAGDGILHALLYLDDPWTGFFVTRDGGQSWSSTQPVHATGLHATPAPGEIILWDGAAPMYVSHDSGVTWSTVTPGVDLGGDLFQLEFVDAAHGWAVSFDGSASRLFQTDDGGASWTRLLP
ncbi:MAG: hypothetical protein ABIJ39_01490 [Chloroflexota bacterium]